MAMGHGGAASLASGCTTVKARHLGVRGGLVDEDDPRRIEVELPFKPPLARRVHRAAGWDYQEFRVWPERLNLFMPLPG